jgi:hypothetical protein
MEAKAKANPNQPRAAVPINNTLEKHLATYMAVAAATGVGVLALAQPSDAEIVYTATNQVLNTISDRVTVDFDKDGVTDLSFGFVGRGYGAALFAYAASQNHFMSGYNGAAQVLPWGKRIGQKGSFNDSVIFLAGANYHFGSCVTYGGYWVGKKGFYLGVQFSSGGETHYGWVRLSIVGPCTTGGNDLLTGYAYETIPNKPIIAGKTSGFAAADTRAQYVFPAPSNQPSLGMLAFGTDGLNIWRRKEEEA